MCVPIFFLRFASRVFADLFGRGIILEYSFHSTGHRISFKLQYGSRQYLMGTSNQARGTIRAEEDQHMEPVQLKHRLLEHLEHQGRLKASPLESIAKEIQREQEKTTLSIPKSQ